MDQRGRREGGFNAVGSRNPPKSFTISRGLAYLCLEMIAGLLWWKRQVFSDFIEYRGSLEHFLEELVVHPCNPSPWETVKGPAV